MALDTFTTQDFICIAQTVTKEVTSHQDATVHAKAGVGLPLLLLMHLLILRIVVTR